MVNNRRGQLTIFVIIGIVIVLSIVGYFVVKSIGDDEPFDGGVKELKSSIVREELLECFDEVYEDSLDLVGIQGGYYNEPYMNYEMRDGYVFVPYYKDSSGVFLPSIGGIEDELEVSVDSSLKYCFRDIVLDYPEFDFYVSEHSTTVLIEEGGVSFVTLVNVGVVFEGVTSLFEFDEEKIVESDLKGMHATSDYYIYMISMYDGDIPADGLVEKALEEGVSIEITNYKDGVLMVSVFAENEQSHPKMYNFLDMPNDVESEEVFEIGEISEGDSEFNVTDFDGGFI
jgi:hypothetical protein